MDPIKYLFEKLVTTGRTARWLMMLSEFDITFIPQKAIKGQAIVDILANGPVGETLSTSLDFPDEQILYIEVEMTKLARWKMCFDGAVNQKGNRVGVVLISPTNAIIPISICLCYPCTNNIAEYEACITGLKAAINLGFTKLEVFGDSALVIFQATGEWFIREEKFLDYHDFLQALSKNFEYLSFSLVAWNINQFADALATLASVIDITHESLMKPIEIKQRSKPAYCLQITADDPNREPWFFDIKRYLEDQTFPFLASKNDQCTLQRLATHFVLHGGSLYKKSPHQVLLRCVDNSEVATIINDIHGRECGPHMNGLMLAKKILRLGYYWSTMEADCCNHVKRCHTCQSYANLIKAPSSELHNLTTPWPFSMWGY